MSKYDPLIAFLSSSRIPSVRMSFADIEEVLGVPLPPSKRHQAWWSNNPSNNVMTRAWLAAGYKTEDVDVVGEQVTFTRSKGGPVNVLSMRHTSPAGSPPRSSLFGCMKGTTILMPGVDLTEPADPEWGKVYGDPEGVSDRVDRIRADAKLSISEKIRALDKLDVPRAEIARLLGKRYQQIRNVLMHR